MSFTLLMHVTRDFEQFWDSMDDSSSTSSPKPRRNFETNSEWSWWSYPCGRRSPSANAEVGHAILETSTSLTMTLCSCATDGESPDDVQGIRPDVHIAREVPA